MDSKLVRKLRPYLAAILLQFGYAGLGIIAKSALDKGMSHYTFAVYRNIAAAVVVAPFAFAFERFDSHLSLPLHSLYSDQMIHVSVEAYY